MHRSGLGGLIIDCETIDIDQAAHFWGGALGCTVKTSADPSDHHYRMLQDASGKLMIEVQQVMHPSRVHLDIKADDVEAEVERLERLGARRIEKIHTWWVMEAPTGHRFCVVQLHPGEDRGPLNEWPG